MSEATRARKRKKSKIGRIKIILLIILVLFMGKSYYEESIKAMKPENPRDIVIDIPVGSSTDKISEILMENQLIKNEMIFKIVVRNKKSDGNLKAGTYTLNTGMNLDNIIKELSKGSKNTDIVRFTIPEGYEIRQIADRLSKNNIIDRDRFLSLTKDKKNFEDKHEFLNEIDENQSLEGFLFPDTYEIYVNSTEEEIIDKMLSRFNKVYDEYIKEEAKDSNLSFNEIVTLASIIEREVKRDDERELVSAVFHNRLNKNMLLQSCATVQFVLGERKERLLDKDTQIESEYNTYIHKGLPPGPIASPGKQSLIAAINPANVDYLYFRTKEDGTGGHTFSKTYDEHKKADPNK